METGIRHDSNFPQQTAKKNDGYVVEVLGMDGHPLVIIRKLGKVKGMLKDRRAKKRSAFTIQLNHEPETHVVRKILSGTDSGRTNIGLCAVREDGECLAAGNSKLGEKRYRN